MSLYSVTVTVNGVSETRHVLASNILAAMRKGADMTLEEDADPNALTVSAERAVDGTGAGARDSRGGVGVSDREKWEHAEVDLREVSEELRECRAERARLTRGLQAMALRVVEDTTRALSEETGEPPLTGSDAAQPAAEIMREVMAQVDAGPQEDGGLVAVPDAVPMVPKSALEWLAGRFAEHDRLTCPETIGGECVFWTCEEDEEAGTPCEERMTDEMPRQCWMQAALKAAGRR